MQRLDTEAPDGGTHSAAACALTRWGQVLPEIQAKTNQPAPGREWFVNRLGMTMVRIPAGDFQMGDRRWTDTRTHPVTNSKSFFISDREVTVALFRQFAEQAADDASTPGLEQLTDCAGGNTAFSPTTNCPIQQVRWFDAVKFCNWFSRQHSNSLYGRSAGLRPA